MQGPQSPEVLLSRRCSHGPAALAVPSAVAGLLIEDFGLGALMPCLCALARLFFLLQLAALRILGQRGETASVAAAVSFPAGRRPAAMLPPWIWIFRRTPAS